MSKIADILKDKKLADDHKIQLAEGVEITLGELRSFDKETRDALAKSLDEEKARFAKEVAQEKAALTKAQTEVAAAWAKLYGGDPDADARRSAGKADDPLAVLAADPLLGPIVQYVQKVETEKIGALNQQLGQVLQAVQTLAMTYAGEKLDDQWGGISAEASKAGHTLESLTKFAVDNRIVNRYGLPDLAAAWERIDAPSRAQRREAELRKEIEERVRAEYETRRVPEAPAWARPTTGPVGGAEKVPFKVDPNRDLLGQALDAALADSDIWRAEKVQ